MSLLHTSRVLRKVRYFIHYSHRDTELDYESDIDEFGLINRRLTYVGPRRAEAITDLSEDFNDILL